jgi:hypothetical protein
MKPLTTVGGQRLTYAICACKLKGARILGAAHIASVELLDQENNEDILNKFTLFLISEQSAVYFLSFLFYLFVKWAL